MDILGLFIALGLCFCATFIPLYFALLKKKRDFKSLMQTDASQKVLIKNKYLQCFHCEYNQFKRIEDLINTTLITFLRLDFLNASAVCFQCKQRKVSR
jgi:hypothetical protein